MKKVALGPNELTFHVRDQDTRGAYSVVEWLMAPPPAPGPSQHIHKTEDEALYVVDGELDVTVEAQTTRAKPGAYPSAQRSPSYGRQPRSGPSPIPHHPFATGIRGLLGRDVRANEGRPTQAGGSAGSSSEVQHGRWRSGSTLRLDASVCA